MTTATDSVILSDGPDGVAPHSGPLRVLVEGWRFRPHSYSLVNMHQCLAMLRAGVVLRHADAPMYHLLGNTNIYGLLSDADEAALKKIPLPTKGDSFDAVYRISYPYNFAPGPAKTFVFATCERMRVDPDSWMGGTGPVGEVIEKNDITILTSSNWSREGFIRSGVDPARVVVVPHGIDPAMFRPLPEGDRNDARKGLGIDSKFVFLNVSALTGNKNVGAVVAAFARVVVKYPQAHLVLKGLDAVYMSNQWLQTEMNGIDAYARWRGAKSMTYIGATTDSASLARMYQTADCYVSPYKSEAFNIPVLEASACGLPVIVPAGGCTDDFLHPGIADTIPATLTESDGFQHLVTSVEDIAAAMERAITDESLRARSLRAGPENAQKYTWSRVTDRLLSVMVASLKGNQ